MTALAHVPASSTRRVDWHSYASVYDVMAELNPAYRDLVALYRDFLSGLRLRAGDLLLEVGAGTGNFSLAAAAQWPHCRVLHVDSSDDMNTRARLKREAQGLGNLEIRTSDVGALDLPDNSIALATAVHALFAFPEPQAVIGRLFRWLRPGGAVFACDPNGALEVGDWARYIFRSACRERGVAQAAWLFLRSREAVRQNRRIGAAMDSGAFWRHDATVFRQAFEDAGFEVNHMRSAYRGVSDLLVAQKPMTVARAARVDETFAAAL